MAFDWNRAHPSPDSLAEASIGRPLFSILVRFAGWASNLVDVRDLDAASSGPFSVVTTQPALDSGSVIWESRALNLFWFGSQIEPPILQQLLRKTPCDRTPEGAGQETCKTNRGEIDSH
jgi:hypothetical protein